MEKIDKAKTVSLKEPIKYTSGKINQEEETPITDVMGEETKLQSAGQGDKEKRKLQLYAFENKFLGKQDLSELVF